MNDYHVTNDKDYNVINNIAYDQLICYQKPTDYSMLFFCIKQNKSNKLASRIFCYLCRLFKKPQPSFKEIISYSFNAIISFLILLSMIVILFWGTKSGMTLFLTCTPPISLLLYFFVQITFDSLNSITIKVADFKVGTSEINKNLMKKGYDKVLLKQYIVNTSNNRFGLVHIQDKTNRTDDINGLSVRIWSLSQMISCYKVINQYVKRINIIRRTYYFITRIWPLSQMISCYKVINQYVKRINIIRRTYYFITRIWPLSQMISCYKVINQYVKRINIIRTYYLKNCNTTDSYDDNDRCCINKLNSTANSIIEIHNKAIDIDRVVIFKNETPIYCSDAI